MKFKLLLIVVSVTFFLWVLAAAVLAQEEPPPPYAGLKNPFPWSDASAQEAGKESYQQYCLGCHGAKGDNLVRSDFSTADYPQSLEERPDFYFWILSEGRVDKGMPSYKSSFSEEQRWQVLTYLSSLGAAAAPPDVTPPPEPESGPPLDCLSHHTKTLKGHDKLGSGSEACWVCHDNLKMGILHLAGGETQFPLSDSPRLCAQCHEERYEAWQEGIHGIPGTIATVKCTGCHDPHQPQIALLQITKPHPEAAPSAPPPPFDLLMIVAISVVFMIGLGIIWARQGETP